MALFLAHTIILLCASFGAARSLVRGLADRIIATAVLAWTNLVVTSLLLSCLHHLGSSAWFFRASLLLALVTWRVLSWVTPVPVPAPADDAKPSRLLLGIFILTLAPLVYASIRIALTYEPNNYDSLSYHLPRVMYYLGQNSLAHFDTGNPRQIYFPFNSNLLQLLGLIYDAPLQCLTFINLASWGIAGLAVYRICRLNALGANSALVATWLAVTATQIVAQATATTNDLPTGAGLMAALLFMLRWRQTRQSRDALLAGLAAGLTLGSKLTVIYFAPAAGLLVLAIAWSHWRQGETRAFFTGLRAWVLPGLLFLGLAAPFAVINVALKHQWINHDYDYLILNRPVSFACFGQTSAAYLLQLFIEPLHRFTYDPAFTNQLNVWGQKTFFPHWNENYAFSPLLLFPPDLNEDHVWFGFAGPFILLCGIFCVFRRRNPPPETWLAVLGLGWFATFFFLNKWSLYNQRYFVPTVLVLSPCAAAVIEAGWTGPRSRRILRAFLIAIAASALWMAGVYLFKNSSRPYAPLWAGTTPPPALPALPQVMVDRLSTQSRINIDSTDGNERIFLLMDLGHNQRFTSFFKPNPAAYNVFSEWGFVRKVAYSNIEQLSSYTVVAVPTKATAGVEFLGTLGSHLYALDYYGLVPHPEQAAATEGNHNVLVVLSYGPRNPGRYAKMRVKVAGLNAPDHARLTLGVDYEDGTSGTLATFTSSGEAPAPFDRPFRRFTVRVTDEASGQEIGAIDIPYLFRDQPPEVEAPDNPTQLFSEELIAPEPKGMITTTGLAAPEGPYPQWDLPLIRWAHAPVLRLEIPATKDLKQLKLSFSLRLHTRDSASIDVVLNGELVKNYPVEGRTTWLTEDLLLTPRAGVNVIEFRNVVVGTEPDWLDYLERYPDIKNYVVSQKLPLAQGAREHYEAFGKHETRTLNLVRHTEKIAMPEQLYFAFRSLHVEGYRKP